MSGIVGMITGSTQRKAAAQAKAAQDAAEKRAQIAADAQQAAQMRATIAEDQRSTQLSAQNSSLVRLSAARRAGRNALSFMAPVAAGFKKTLGA